jgi:DNA polymerase IV
MVRRIIHLDMDAFYASVEQGDRPELRGKPVIVGGTIARGVVCACSYEARRYGIHSAMPMARAVRLCPQGIVLPVRMSRYRAVSEKVFAIFARYTDRLEPLSLDEAFLDVTGCERLFGVPKDIATTIRQEVRRETGLAVSAGIAPNKFLAKLATDRAKPDGLLEVMEEDVAAFLSPLPVGAVWGVGKKTAARLEGLGVRTIGELQRVDHDRLVKLFGAAGHQLYHLARGNDERPVEEESRLRSIGHEETFHQDLWSVEEMHLALLELAERVSHRLRSHDLVGRCIVLKVKFGDFVTVTRNRTCAEGINTTQAVCRAATELLENTEAGQRPVRLLGIAVSQLQERRTGQTELFGNEERLRNESLDRAMDKVREKFGDDGLCRGSLLRGPIRGKKKG